jgi:RNA polymerase sigma-54 factor
MKIGKELLPLYHILRIIQSGIKRNIMAQELIQTQEQQLTQQLQQRLTAQQVMVVRMLEMPLAQLEQNIQAEMDENPALEGETADFTDDAAAEDRDNGDEEAGEQGEDGNFEEEEERKEREDELDSVLDSIDKDDRLDASNYERTNNTDPDADQEEHIYGNTESFYDNLLEQMREQPLTERQELIMEYLIGSLDNDGLLRKELSTVSDEIAIKEYIDVSEDEIEHCLTILQSFDPAGIGAQSLQQCLLIQIFRKQPSRLTSLMHRVINECYTEFTKKHWKKIMEKLDLSEYTAEEVFAEIRKLNPRPGAALGETMGRNTQQVTPDFIIDTDDGGSISFTLNRGKVPQLYVSPDFENMIEAYRQNPQSMTRSDKEALLYAQQKVNRAKSYIDAVLQRQNTMISTMRGIIALQKPFLLSGDDADLKPMILKDVAQRAGVDISTVSRVCSSKYAETPWGIIPLKSFFSDAYDTGNGETVSTRIIKNALRELIENEESGKPLSDIKLAEEMKKLGYPIARRTVAKYREQLGISSSNLR